MSIFVDAKDVIEVAVYYREDNGNVVIFEEPTSQTSSLKVTFRRPDFSISQRLIAASTLPDPSGNPTLNLMTLQNNLLYFLAQSWNACEPENTDSEGKKIPGKPIELNNENIGRLRVEIARDLVMKLVSAVGQLM